VRGHLRARIRIADEEDRHIHLAEREAVFDPAVVQRLDHLAHFDAVDLVTKFRKALDQSVPAKLYRRDFIACARTERKADGRAVIDAPEHLSERVAFSGPLRLRIEKRSAPRIAQSARSRVPAIVLLPR